MNTPKRNHKTVNPSTSAIYQESRKLIELARWKRKNRIRQLKHTIARQKKEYESLWKSFSHMSKRCCELLYPTNKQP